MTLKTFKLVPARVQQEAERIVRCLRLHDPHAFNYADFALEDGYIVVRAKKLLKRQCDQLLDIIRGVTLALKDQYGLCDKCLEALGPDGVCPRHLLATQTPPKGENK